MMKTELDRKYFKLALILSMLISLTIHFQLILVVLFEETERHRRESVDLGFAGIELLFTILETFLIFMLNYYLIKPFERYRKLNVKTVLVSIFLSFISSFIFVFIFNFIKRTVGYEATFHSHHNETLYRNLFSTTLVLASIFIIRLIYQKQSFELENETLKNESLQRQFESLKNQMSPHFLFNTLTALNSLIKESPDIAGEYVNHLAQVLRYTLQGNDKKTVTLREEMDFIESYLFLIKMRYGENLIIKSDIHEKYMMLELPPLTIQTLLENAVKHNEISNRKPLTIVIQTNENAEIAISNQINKKLTPEEGTGIGLTNLSKQFHLLGEKEIQIIEKDNKFTVIIPLITPVIL